MSPPDPEPPHRFDAPWQAKAFALCVHLEARGAFTWAEWSASLADACAGQGPDPAGSGEAYYTAWLRALENLLAARGLAAPARIDATAARWHRAARATPHGEPIRIDAADPARTPDPPPIW